MPSPTFQLKSITFVPYILASSSDSYDPKTSVAKFMLPRSPHLFGISSNPKTCDHTVLPKLHRRFGHLTLTSRGHHGKDLGLLVGGTAKNQPEMIPWSGWHFFDQKGVGWIQSPAMWKLYNLYKFCLFFWMVVYYHGCKWFLWKCFFVVESTLEIFRF